MASRIGGPVPPALAQKISNVLNPAIRRRMRGVLTPTESTEEGKFVEACRRAGWRTRKLNGEGQRDWPDRLVCLPYGLTALIEFKRRGKKANDGQAEKHQQLTQLGHNVVVLDTSTEALSFCESLIKVKRLARGLRKAIIG